MLPIDHETATPTTDLRSAISEADMVIGAIDLPGGVVADLQRGAMIKIKRGILIALAMIETKDSTPAEIAVGTVIETGIEGIETEIGIGIGTDIVTITVGVAATTLARDLALGIAHVPVPALITVNVTAIAIGLEIETAIGTAAGIERAGITGTAERSGTPGTTAREGTAETFEIGKEIENETLGNETVTVTMRLRGHPLHPDGDHARVGDHDPADDPLDKPPAPSTSTATCHRLATAADLLVAAFGLPSAWSESAKNVRVMGKPIDTSPAESESEQNEENEIGNRRTRNRNALAKQTIVDRAEEAPVGAGVAAGSRHVLYFIMGCTLLAIGTGICIIGKYRI